ncbi:MAG: hypothetical protein PCFJNLEI_01004 [Verrucomicrobiae bacterium]|nr:hypothetical protein [Verrucomicrobiae bacterium]
MMKKILLLCGSLLTGWLSPASAQTTGWNQTGAGVYDYTNTANWVGGDVNGIWDSTLTLVGTPVVTFDHDAVLATGFNFLYAGSFHMSLVGTNGNRTITLGGDILAEPDSTTRILTIGNTTAGKNLDVDLGGVTRTLTINSGSLHFLNSIGNGGIIKEGGATLSIAGATTYSGDTVVNRGILSLTGANGAIANSAVTLNGNGNVRFDSSANGVVGTTRVGSLLLNKGTLSVVGNATANSVDGIGGALIVGAGSISTVSIGANSARNAQLSIGSFVRAAGSSVMLIRGSGLGTNTIASATASSANVTFGTTPTLLGGGGGIGTTTRSILVGVLAETNTATGSGSGLATYDSTYGLRLLDAATEYTSGIVNGQTQLDNVRYVNTSGSGVITNILTANTTINSLSFNVTGVGTNTGVAILGDTLSRQLVLNSGAIFVQQSIDVDHASDAMILSNLTLNLNGREGVFTAFTAGLNQGNTPGRLEIYGVITNDGGNGVTFGGGSGQIMLGGGTTNKYTGVTTLNSGVLLLAKTIQNNSVPGDLVINGGILLKTGNAIPDTANLTLNGGTFVMDSTLSSGNNGHPETINNLTMNGGNLSYSSSGNSAVLNINGAALINSNDLRSQTGGDVTVAGLTTLNGGRIVVPISTAAVSVNAIFNFNDILIQAPASGVYTGIVFFSHATNRAGKLVLNGDLTVNANLANPNTVMIANTNNSVANLGHIALNGIRTFTIGNGPAAVDVEIAVAITNEGAAVGGIIKAGAGALLLSGNNLYTGATTVNAGTLQAGAANTVSGTAQLSVANGATVNFGAFDQVVGSVSGGGRIINNAALQAGADNTSTTYSGIMSGTGSLTKNGTGTLILSGNNSYNGGTTVNAGTLQASAANVLSSSGALTVNSGGTVNFGAFNQSIGSLAGGGHITNRAALTVGGNNASTTFTGVISGSGSLTKVGSGQLVLSGNNTYTGTTALNGGTLRVNGSLATPALTVASGAKLGGSGTIAGAVTIQNNGTLAPGNSIGTNTVGSLTLNASSVLEWEFQISPPYISDFTIVTNNNGLTVNGGKLYTYQDGTAFPFQVAGLYRLMQYTGALSGTGVSAMTWENNSGLAYNFGTASVGSTNFVTFVIGAGTVGWDGGSTTDSYWTNAVNWGSDTAPTNYSRLAFNTFNRVINTNNFAADTPFAGMVFSNGSGAFQLAGNRVALAGDIVNNSPLQQTIHLDLLLNTIDAQFNTAAGNIEVTGDIVESGGSFGLIKTGTKSLILSGNSTYSGATLVNNGTLLVNGSLSAAPNAVFVSAGATLGGTGTISRAVNVAGGGNLNPGAPDPGQLSINDTLTLANNFRFTWDLGLTTTDSVSATTINFTGASWTLQLGSAAWNAATNDQFMLMEWGTGINTAALTNSVQILGGKWNTSQASVFIQGNQLWLTGVEVIPEPSVLLLWVCGAGAVYLARRRQRISGTGSTS